MAYIWFVIGAVAVTAAFFLATDPVDPWPAVEAGTIAGSLVMLAVAIYATRKPFPRKSRIGILLFTLLFIVAAGSFSMKLKETTNWQKSQLLKILGVIQRGIFDSQIPDPMLTTLERYHRQTKKRKSIGDVFREVMPGVTVGKDIFSGGASDSLRLFVAAISDDQIVLIGEPSWGSGRDPDFTNYDGKKGLVQERAVLTVKGVTYESQN